jgi:hypothetical protein
LLSYFTALASRLRLARSSFLTIFFSADNMSAVVSAISIRPAAGQITIGNSEAFPSPLRGRKFFLSGYRVDKTISRLRYG